MPDNKTKNTPPTSHGPLLGAHMSVSGGLHRAIERIMEVDGTALQVFTRNQRQWNHAPLSDEETEAFGTAWATWGTHHPIVSHDSYLINLASPKDDAADKSMHAFRAEIERCAALGIQGVVCHPGSHLGKGVDSGIAHYVERLDAVLDNTVVADGKGPRILLETTAGQGTNLGSSFEELAAIIAASRHAARLAVCFDTCHAFAAGYDIRTPGTYAKVFEDFDRHVGLDRIALFHLNDALVPLASRKDRHTHIGHGEIGLEGFGLIMRDARFDEVPKVLETPKEDDMADDRMNMDVLRALARGETPELGGPKKKK